jgi:hypothetical protein
MTGKAGSATTKVAMITYPQVNLYVYKTQRVVPLVTHATFALQQYVQELHGESVRVHHEWQDNMLTANLRFSQSVWFLYMEYDVDYVSVDPASLLTDAIQFMRNFLMDVLFRNSNEIQPVVAFDPVMYVEFPDVDDERFRDQPLRLSLIPLATIPDVAVPMPDDSPEDLHALTLASFMAESLLESPPTTSAASKTSKSPAKKAKSPPKKTAWRNETITEL